MSVSFAPGYLVLTLKDIDYGSAFS